MPAIEKIDKEEMLSHLISLDEDARRLRFGFSATDASIIKYVEGIQDIDYLFGIRESLVDNTVIAVLHLAIDQDANCAELGISTLYHARRKGLAERLLRTSIDILRNRGITQIYSVCLPDNYPLLSLIRKLNITSITHEEGDKQARISIPMAGVDSFYTEMYNQRMVIIDRSMKPWATLWHAMMKKQDEQKT